MDETVDQIEAHIDHTRQRLGSNLQELERRVDAATDWREQFRARPYVGLGLAFAGGLAVASLLHARSDSAFGGREETRDARRPSNGSDAREQALDAWNSIKGALIGVATTRIKDYIGDLIPGFQDQLQRTEQRTAAFRRSDLSGDRT